MSEHCAVFWMSHLNGLSANGYHFLILLAQIPSDKIIQLNNILIHHNSSASTTIVPFDFVGTNFPLIYWLGSAQYLQLMTKHL
jgi:hypothetical protein